MVKSDAVSNTPSSTYPLLRIYSPKKDFIVLMTGPTVGTVVWSKNPDWKVGDHARDWANNNFEVYTGTVTLENE